MAGQGCKCRRECRGWVSEGLQGIVKGSEGMCRIVRVRDAHAMDWHAPCWRWNSLTQFTGMMFTDYPRKGEECDSQGMLLAGLERAERG